MSTKTRRAKFETEYAEFMNMTPREMPYVLPADVVISLRAALRKLDGTDPDTLTLSQLRRIRAILEETPDGT